MVTLDTSYVRQQLRAIADSSNAVRKLLYDTLERLETDPSSFPPLESVPPTVAARYPSVSFRKAKIESGRHTYRLVFAQWQFKDRDDHVDVLYAFPRRSGYPIDWDEVDEMLGQ